jgi:hypothetical protein
MKEGMNDFVSMSDSLPEAAKKMVAEKRAAIVSGKWKVFTGPILAQDGSTKVPTGTSLTDKEIDSIDWYVQGVEGKVPGK